MNLLRIQVVHQNLIAVRIRLNNELASLAGKLHMQYYLMGYETPWKNPLDKHKPTAES